MRDRNQVELERERGRTKERIEPEALVTLATIPSLLTLLETKTFRYLRYLMYLYAALLLLSFSPFVPVYVTDINSLPNDQIRFRLAGMMIAWLVVVASIIIVFLYKSQKYRTLATDFSAAAKSAQEAELKLDDFRFEQIKKSLPTT